ncbi:MAG: helix-turn-helix transcriptional regulator [Firmicutes bacterium]|nr:helix-turn-helix transcriptional regulator [Bacillota bacterium]
MYKTLLAIENTKLLSRLKGLDIWNKKTGLELTAVSAQDTRLRGGDIDLIVAEVSQNNLSELIEALTALKQSLGKDNTAMYVSELAQLFNSRDAAFLTRLKETADGIDRGLAGKTAMQLVADIADAVFEENEWLDLYINKNDIAAYGDTGNTADNFVTSLTNFFAGFSELYPNIQSEKIRNVILYILNNPESDLKQKSIAASLYMNSSYLSTVFTAHTQLRFVDYLTNVKLRRAAWLLRSTTLKVADIAERLDYKDMGYFSRLFKKKFGVTPSDYRVPDSYNYQI